MFENGQLTVLNIRDILPNRFQPRIRFDEEKLEELADSINKYGVIQPVVVRPIGSKFEIIAGERRYKASKLANKSTIPAIIVNLSDKDSEEIALLENIQRQQLSPIEEAVSYKRILDMGYITQEELARKLGKAQSTIANKIRLLNLDDEVQSYLLNNKISERHARSLLRIPDKEKQVQMLHRIVEERLTVKQTDKEIEKLKSETEIENREIKPITIDIPKPPVQSEPEEIESLFDETEEKTSSNERGNNAMDIDRIMREAKDINVPTKEEPRDISGLMQPGNDVQSEPIVRQEEPKNLENSKFISVAPAPEVVKPVEPQVSAGVTFDSMFNQHITPEPVPTASETAQPVNPTPTIQPTVTPVNQTLNETVSVSPVQPVNPAPVIDTNTQQASAQMNSVPEVSPIQEVAPAEPLVSDDTKKVISSAVANALRKYNEKKVHKENQPSVNEVSPVQPTEVASVNQPANTQPVNPASVIDTNAQQASVQMNSVSEVNPSSRQTPPIPNTDIISDNALNEYAINPTAASTIAQDVKPVNNQAHFAQIVKLLRECADKIEQNGYFVNVDELDLGNQYKVTFTIDKE